MSLVLHPLPLTTFLPLVGILVILFLKSEWKNAIRWVALLTTIVTFAISVVMLTYFQPGNPDIQMEINIPWFNFVNWTLYFHLGVDGLSILLVMLTTLLIPISILSTWTAIQDRVKDFMIFFLLLEVGMVGVFVALDLFLFYIFWEFTLVPMYFLIGVWGGPRRMYAAVKFFLYTMAGSILMLLAGVLLKMGTYGFLRFNLSMFPSAAVKLAPWIAGLATIGILYGAAVSYAQKDVKKLGAFSSVSPLGFVMLGLFALNAKGIG